jgi:hypothetical protein
MHCNTCGYALWNLRARQCPECGTAFSPSDFEFLANSVAFCCPHCEQTYYGTDVRGHLVPRRFNCVTCGQNISMDDVIVRPAEGVDERDTQADKVPWLVREHRGRWSMFFLTIGRALVSPHKLGRGIPESGNLGAAWGFATLCALLTSATVTIPFVLFFGFITAGAGGGAALMISLWLSVFFFALCFMSIFGSLIIWGALGHWLLVMTGETKRRMGRTYECLCYSSGANFTSAFPILGIYVGWIWWIVSAVFVLRDGQNVSVGRAALAAIVPPIATSLVIVGGFLGMGLLLPWMAGGGGGGGFVMATSATRPIDAATSVRQLTTSLVVSSRSASRISHGAQLIVEGFASPAMFIADSTDTLPSDVAFGYAEGKVGMSLRDMETLPVSEQREIVARAAENLPDGVIAHRVGDFVFTFHGINIANGDTRLWLVIASPDPDRNEADSFDGTLYTGIRRESFGAFVHHIPEAKFDEDLRRQNEIRALYNLPPLPHPREISHASPAVGTRADSTNEDSD